MAFPVVNARNAGTSSGTSHIINLPDGIVTGKLLGAFFNVDGNQTPTWPTGWTQVAIRATAQLTIEYRERVVDGTEGFDGLGDTITVTTGGSVLGGHRTWLIGGHNASTTPSEGATAQGSSTAPNPPALDPAGWGAEDTLWLALAGLDVTTDIVTGFPTSYLNTFTQSGGKTLGTAERELNAASEDPGAFALSASVAWRVMTVAIRPAAGDITDSGTVTVVGTQTGAEALADAGTQVAVLSPMALEAVGDAGSQTIVAALTGLEAIADGATPVVVVLLSGDHEVPGGDVVESGTATAVLLLQGDEALVDSGSLVAAVPLTGDEAVADQGTLATVAILAGLEALADGGVVTVVVEPSEVPSPVSWRIAEGVGVTSLPEGAGVTTISEGAGGTSVSEGIGAATVGEGAASSSVGEGSPT